MLSVVGGNKDRDESVFLDVIENLPHALQVFDAEGFSRLVNKKQRNRLGLEDSGDWIGKFNVLTDPFSVKNGSAAVYAEACEGRPVRRIFESDPGMPKNHRKPRKGVRHLRETVIPVRNADGGINGIISVLEDITGAERARVRIEERERFFKMVAENAPDAIYIQTDGKFSYLNGQALRLFGADHPDQLIGQPVMDRFHPDFHDMVGERITGPNEKKESRPGAIVFVRDITERKLAEKKLKAQYELLANLTAQIPGVVYQLRLYPDGQSAFPFSSPGMREIFEISPEEVTGDASAVMARIHPEDCQYILNGIHESARNQSLYHSEFRVLLPGQGLKWRECFAKPETLADGSTLWHGIISDITDRKRTELALVEAMREAEESDQLITAFLQNLSHEIRTPMNAIIGFTDMLKGDNLSPEERNAYIDTIITGTDQLLSVVNDIVTISMLESGQEQLNVSPIGTNGIIDNLFTVFEPQARFRGLDLVCRKPLDDSATLLTDGTKILQIMTNLVANALKFTPAGKVEFGYVADNGKCVFFVSDTGIGIEPECLELIFECFRQADSTPARRYGGTGLGLSISRALATLLGTRIVVESEPGRGSTLSFAIPDRRADTLIRKDKMSCG